MKTTNDLLNLIETETASFEAKKAEKGIMAAIAGRKDYACQWATENGCEIPSNEMLRKNPGLSLSELATMLPKVSR